MSLRTRTTVAGSARLRTRAKSHQFISEKRCRPSFATMGRSGKGEGLDMQIRRAS
jgi:hypothetical protein